MNRKLHAFLAGMTSILFIQPAISSTRISVPNSDKTNSEILRDDFKRIGGDFEVATAKVINEVNLAKKQKGHNQK